MVQNRACGVIPLKQHVAAAIEGLAGVVGVGIECDPVAGADRQFAGACDHRARIGVDARAFRSSAMRSRRR